MISSPENLNYFTQFNRILKNIDINIIKLSDNPKELNPVLLKETNQLICSGSLILAKLHEKKEKKEIIEKEYANLEERRNRFTSISKIYRLDALNKYNNDMNNISPYNDEKNEIIDIGLTTDYNEKLLQGSMHNLYEVNNNLNIVAHSLKNQGEQLNDVSERIIAGNEKSIQTGKILSEVNKKQRWQKISMFVINILLFSVIILLLIVRIVNFFKY